MWFAPSQYEDPTNALFKLTQHSIVSNYLSEFEDLANRIIGLPPPFLLSCFISGLTPKIRCEVQALQRCVVGLTPIRHPHPSWLIPLLPTPLKSPSSIPLKRLSSEELVSRRERDLCFNCDEKFHHGHKCSSRVFILIAEDDEGP